MMRASRGPLRLTLAAAMVAGLVGGAMAQQAPAPVNPAAAKPSTATAKPATAATPAKPGNGYKPTPKPAKPAGPVDAAYGAFQRGQFKTAMDLALVRANAGDPIAMVLVGELLSQGYGVRQDSAAAGKWFEAAAATGNADALFTLAAIKMAAKSTQQKDEAVDMFRQAAEKGNSAAAYNLGLLYLEGQVAPKEPTIAAEWFRRAADKDQPDALYALATLYRDGRGVPKNPNEMALLLQQADALGNVVATTEYAIALFNGTGVPKDEEKAARLFRKAALAGNAIAQNRLARLLSTGRGVPQDQVAAASWYLAAKSQKLDDEMMEKMVAQLTPQQRKQAEDKLKIWAGQVAPAF